MRAAIEIFLNRRLHLQAHTLGECTAYFHPFAGDPNLHVIRKAEPR
jgi:hypothetical protein